jgi:hypothetical protein
MFFKNTVEMVEEEEPLVIYLIDSKDMYHLVAAIPINICYGTSADKSAYKS